MFTVRWPAFARLEATFIFIAILALSSKFPTMRNTLGPASVATAGGAADPSAWGMLAMLEAGPCFVALLVVDRLLRARHGFAWLSGLAVVTWSGLAAIFSRDIASALPANLTAGNALVPFTAEAAIAGASIALLVHARALWIGLAGQDAGGMAVARSGTAVSLFNPPARPTWPAFGHPLSRVVASMSLGIVVFVVKSSLMLHLGARPASSPSLSGPGEAEAWRTQNGSFFFPAMINDQSTSMLFDTGASWVTVRAEDASRFGIATDRLRYTMQARTANGTSSLARVTLPALTVGSITMHDVPAVVAQPGVLHDNLLGQTFLARLRDFRMEGDRVILHAD